MLGAGSSGSTVTPPFLSWDTAGEEPQGRVSLLCAFRNLDKDANACEFFGIHACPCVCVCPCLCMCACVHICANVCVFFLSSLVSCICETTCSISLQLCVHVCMCVCVCLSDPVVYPRFCVSQSQCVRVSVDVWHSCII